MSIAARLCKIAFVGLAIIATSGDSRAADAIPERDFAPVQLGPTSDADALPIYEPGRILLRLSGPALDRSTLPRQRRGASQAPGTTGLPTLDAILRAEGLRTIDKAYIEVQDLTLDRQLGVSRWYLAEVATSTDVVALARRLEQTQEVEAATPDWRAFPAAVPNDPLHAAHWGHDNTGQLLDYCWGCGGHPGGSPVGTPGFDADAETAWDAASGYGSSSVVIAILDSGVDAGHPDLNQVTGYDFGDGDSNPDDDSSDPGHGTACAGVAAAIANNGLGSAGVAGGSSIMPLKVANSAGSLLFSYIQNALYYAADNGADVASMSFGAAISSDPATNTALQYAHSNGVTLLAATGNENASSISYPANHADVIGVGAASPCGERKRSSSSSSEVNPGVSTDPNGYTCDGERWWGSNYGTNSQDASGAVDVIAPTILPTTDIQGSGGYDSSNYSMWFNGTSCATPYAAGVCGLILSANPGFTPDQVRAALVGSCEDVTSVESGSGWDRYTGYGMVDAAAAVGSGGGPGGDDPVYATLPYTTGFESGDLDDSWTDDSTGDGRVQVTTGNSPHGGSWHVTLDDASSGGYTTNQIDLHLDLSGESQVDLDFWWKEFGDETHSQDGVYVSDDGGSSFAKVHDLNGGSTSNNTWQSISLDLDALASTAGRSLTATFVVRFQQYDNYPIATDGFAFDDIAVTSGGGGGPSDRATVPYTTGFESGSFDGYWSSSSTSTGRVLVTTANGPYAGSYHLTMDSATSGSYATNEAWLLLDLAGESQVDLDFRWKEFSDETHSQDGVYFSDDDGASFTKVHDLSGGSSSWQLVSLDLDALASGAGLALNDEFVVKFQQYDNYPIATDGFGFDAISVTEGSGGGGPSYITAESEPNGSGGSADGPVGAGVSVAGTISSSSDDDWFYLDVSTAGTITISVDIGSSADLDWYLYADGDLSNWVARGYTVSNPEQGSYSASPGRYYVRVDGYQGATSGYTLTVTGGGIAVPQAPEKPDLPHAFALGANRPNPFNPSTTIPLALPENAPVRLDLFSVDGRRVRTLIDEELAAGWHTIRWDGRDDAGLEVASGVYLLRMRAGRYSGTQKLMLMK